jgi:hypothetical protein
VTFNTTDVVVSWPKTIFDSLTFGKDEFVVFKPAVPARGGCYRLIHAFLNWGAFDAETIEEVIGLGVHISGQSFGSSLAFNSSRGA